MNKWLLMFLWIAFLSPVSAQEDEPTEDETEIEGEFPQPTASIDKFFNDGRAVLKNNAVKLDAMSLFRGNLLVAYERKLFSSMSVEVWGGTKYFNGPSLGNLYLLTMEEDLGETVLKSTVPFKSYVYGGTLRWYFKQAAIDGGMYVAPYYQKVVTVMNAEKFPDLKKYSTTSMCVQYGRQVLLKKKLSVDGGLYTGVNIYNPIETSPENQERLFYLDYGLVIKYGFYF